MRFLYELNSEEIKKVFYENRNNYIATAILKHKNTPTELLLKNTNNYNIVQNIYLKDEVYEKILKEKYECIVSMACRVSHTPIWFLEKALEIFPNNYDVEYSIARLLDRKLTDNLYKKLSLSSRWEVRSCIAKNKCVPKKYLSELQNDIDSRVLISVKDRLNESDYNMGIKNCGMFHN